MNSNLVNDTKQWIRKTLTPDEKRHLIEMVTLKNETDYLKKLKILNDWYVNKDSLDATDIINMRKWIYNQTLYKKTSITLTSLVNIFGIKKIVGMLGCPEELLDKIVRTKIYFDEAFNYKHKDTEKNIETVKISKIIKDIITGGLGDEQIKGIQELIKTIA
jgi:hypothetical protein